jgi:hypothetical protein
VPLPTNIKTPNLILFFNHHRRFNPLAMEDRWIGLILALISSVFIGMSFVLTKKGLIASRGRGASCAL